MNIDISKVNTIIREIINNDKISVHDVEKVQALIQQVNKIIYDTPILKIQTVQVGDVMTNMKKFQEETEAVLCAWEEYQKLSIGNSTNMQFAKIYGFFKYVDSKIIYDTIVLYFESLPAEVKEDYAHYIPGFGFIKTRLDYKNKDYSLIKQHVDMMSNRIEDYKWLYDHLGDWRSKIILNEIVYHWFTFDMDRLWKLPENIFSDYFDLDLIDCSSEEVFVDLGAYVGDSTIDFIKTYGTYKKIYCYELAPTTCKKLEENLFGLDNIIIRNKGVGNKNEVIYIEDSELDAGNSITQKGNCPVELVAIDEDICEPITCIKMDIEGAEKGALAGARNHIVNEKPKLLISAYHIPDDIFDIPKMIKDMRDDYKLYLRYNGKVGHIWPCDYIVFGI